MAARIAGKVAVITGTIFCFVCIRYTINSLKKVCYSKPLCWAAVVAAEIHCANNTDNSEAGVLSEHMLLYVS